MSSPLSLGPQPVRRVQPADAPPLVSTTPARRIDFVLAGAVVALLLAALLAAAPFARVQLPGSAPMVPAYFVAVMICHALTAVLLLGQHAVQPSRPVLVLAAGYLFAGCMIVPWAISFPGAFPAFEGEWRLNATATIAAAQRLGFPLFVLAYALWPRRQAAGAPGAGMIAATVGLVAAAVIGFAWLVLFTEAPLPPFMRDARHVAPLWEVVPPTALVICVAAIAALRARARPRPGSAWRSGSLLDLWLVVVLVSLIIEIVLLAWLSAGVRLSLGWWAGRLYGLFAAGAVLVLLLFGTTTLHARHARSVFAERRAQDSRLTVIEALSATIAHELRQPLSGVELGAAAGLRWLRRDPPDLGEVEAALVRIEAVGERAARVVEAIRTAFRADGAPRVEVDVNAALREVIRRRRTEAAMDRVELRVDLAPDLPPVHVDPLHLELVLINLVQNAFDAMHGVEGRPRRLCVASDLDGASVAISIADTGGGLPEGMEDRLFSAFFTTKPEGMGIGLMFCRTIVETHGGRIWCENGRPHGAVFRISLPAA